MPFSFGMRRILRWLLPLAVLLIGVWYVTSPRRAWDHFLHAIVTGQESELQATIDFPELRSNLRRDIRTALASRPGVPAALTGPLADQIIATAVTPRGLSRLVTAFGTRTPDPTDIDSLEASTVTSFRYRSPSRVEVRIRPTGADPEQSGIFTFSRSGIHWRLTRISGSSLPTLGGAP